MWYNQRYKSVGERAADAQKKLKKLQKKDPSINPVIIEGKQIATTWWGRHGQAILNTTPTLIIEWGVEEVTSKMDSLSTYPLKGLIEGMVMGTRSQPYKIKIKIKSLSDAKWKRITALSQNLHSLTELLEGSFPRELENVFSNTAEGIFPSLKEMNFGCTCPDWASMCKHVSAASFMPQESVSMKILDSSFN